MYYNLTQINKTAINNIIKKHNNVTILYYSNMCGHCIHLKPVWSKICKKSTKSIYEVIINVENNNITHLKAKYKKNISGYPTIMKYNKGKFVSEYQGNRNKTDLCKFIKK